MRVVYKNIFKAAVCILPLFSCSNHKKESTTAASIPFDTRKILYYDPKTADRKIDAFVQNLHAKHGFNGNILVAKDGKIIYENSIGWADYLRRDSLNIDSRFQLASVSKPFTGTATLMLMEQGKLKLDDSVQHFFPDFPYHGITVRMLLSHQSGMNNYQYAFEKVWDQHKPMYNTDVLALYKQYHPHYYNKPGQTFFYNNTNFMLLGAIIEKASGMPYAQFMKENIFDPLGMKNTVVYSKAKDKAVPTNVWGYDRVWRRSVVPNYLDGVIGDKGIYSTVKDMYLFDQGLQKGKLLKPETMKMAYTPTAPEPKHHKHFNYGLGWRLFTEDDGKVVIYHTGWWHGFQNMFVRDLNNHVTIVILSNVFNGSIAQIDDLYKLTDMPVIRKGAYAD
ncbi:serine hydrolase domain-containing protein [Mucilaginibacter koreensis]